LGDQRGSSVRGVGAEKTNGLVDLRKGKLGKGFGRRGPERDGLALAGRTTCGQRNKNGGKAE
jgi:hypothetical protein